MRIPIFPSSRAGRLIYMTGAIVGVLGCLGAAWRDHQLEKAYADHGALADVLPVTSYLSHYQKSRIGDTKTHLWDSADLSFRTPDGEKWTSTQSIDQDEIDALRNGRTLQMEYLPEHPQSSARLAGHRRKAWESLAFAALLAIYALGLKPPRALPHAAPRARVR